MPHGRMAASLALIAGLLLGGCSAPKEMFLHQWHRENYAIGDHELAKLQFYISTRVVAKESASPTQSSTPESVIVVPDGTPGLVTEVGPSWLRVSFQETGSGVPFVADTSQRDDSYWLATEVAGQEGLHKVKDLPERILLHEGRRYRLVSGASAHLLIGSRDLEELIARRRHLQGRTVEPD